MVFLDLTSCGGESESEREERAMRAAVPIRTQSDGTIRLTEQDRAAAGLVVIAAAEGDLPSVEVRFGRVRARTGEVALVVAPMSGRIARAPVVQLGAVVATGDAIVEVVPVLGTADRISIGVQGAQLDGQILGATAELATRQTEASRARALAGASMSAERVQQAELAVATTRDRLEALRRARGASSAVQGTPAMLRAPASGTIVSLTTVVGAVVQPGETLATILLPGPRWIDVSVPTDDPSGTAYQVATPGATWTSARWLARGALVEDDGTRHDRLEVSEHTALLLPGATVAVRVVREQAHGVVLPDAALVPGIGGDIAYIETAPGVFAPRSVQVAARLGTQVRLAAGIEAGERVVTQGAMALRGESLRSALRHVE